MRWKLLGVLLLGLLILGSFGSADIVKGSNDKACQPVKYWVFENGQWVEKSEPRIWWYCQEPEKIKNFEGFAFKEKPYGLLKKPDQIALHRATRQLINLIGGDELHGKLSANLPSYGGMFINEEKGLIFVYVKDEKDKEKIKQALMVYRGKINLVFLKGKYSFEQLVQWKNLALNLSIEKLGISGIDADEAHNMLTIELEEVTPEKLKILENELDKLGIPKSAVRIEKVRRMSLERSPTDVFDPLIGGIGIRVNSGYSSTCTLGFTAKINGENYFVTAAHCAGFGNTGNSVYQPWGILSWRKVGVVVKNPPLKNEGDKKVRESDSLLVKVSGRSIAPQIYSDWKVEGITESVVGLYVCKFGIGTKATNCGHVMKTNKISVLEGGILLTDTSEVVGMEHAQKDSGAPVFVKPYYVPNTRIVGIHFGGVEGTTITGFSEIDGIFCELGNMVVAYDS